jgi:predicted RNA binding protein YcfA (HicA-like mRNA interferase family)
MPKLPVVSGEELGRALVRLGFEQDRERGSHVFFIKPGDPPRTTTVPMHREVAKGTLRAILNQTGVTVEELLENL